MQQAVLNEADEVKWHLTFTYTLLSGGVFLGKMSVVMNCTSIQHLAHLSSPLSTFSLGLINT